MRQSEEILLDLNFAAPTFTLSKQEQQQNKSRARQTARQRWPGKIQKRRYFLKMSGRLK